MKTAIRTYRDEDFQGVFLLLKENLEFEELSEKLLKEKIYGDPDLNMESTFVAEDGDAIIGFLMGVERDVRGLSIGYIKLLAVDSAYRRKGLATQMYKLLEQLFLQKGIQAVRICDVPLNYLVPGLDPRYTEAICLAERLGFTKNGEAVNMHVDLDFSEWNTSGRIKELKAEGIHIARAKKEELEEVLDFVRKEWALWEFELRAAMKNDPPSLYIARKDSAIMAFSAYDGNNAGTGWFGPMGTDPALRGKGIGSVLLYLCLEDIKNSGLKSATIPWVAPIAFYSHYAGARISRTFWRFEKKLETEDFLE